MIKRIWIAAALCGLALAACSPASPTQPGEAYPSPSGPTQSGEGYPSPSNPTPGGYPAPAGDPLAGTGWILTEVNGQPALADVSVTLEFADGRLGGSDGCNSYGGGYRVEDGRLIVGADMASTLMACADEIMQQASAFTAVLLQSPAFSIEGERLTLLGEDGAALAVFAAQSQELAGTSWIVTGMNDGSQAVVSPLLDTEITAAFGADGQVSGSAGCNRYFASFSVDGNTIKIGAPGATKMFCGEPAGLMEQESRFLKALESASSYRVSGGTLTLFAADGSTAVALVRAP